VPGCGRFELKYSRSPATNGSASRNSPVDHGSATAGCHAPLAKLDDMIENLLRSGVARSKYAVRPSDENATAHSGASVDTAPPANSRGVVNGVVDAYGGGGGGGATGGVSGRRTELPHPAQTMTNANRMAR